MNLIALFIFFSCCLALGIILIIVSNFFGKRPSHKRQYDIYESGVNPVGSAISRYDVKFYLTAILFLLFDVEVVLLFPWALTYRKAHVKNFLLIEFVFFMLILLAGFMFVLFSRGLEWED